MDAVTSPAISVVVATRNRPEHIGQCVALILAQREIPFELIVIDQSDGSDAAAVENTDPRMQWMRTDSRGLSTARNAGVAMARAPIVAFTDDDCRVPLNWVSSIAAQFAGDPEISLLFGAVTVTPEDRARGFAASFTPKGVRELQGRIPDMRASWGIGANMAVRRSAFEAVGTFDPGLGVGSSLFAGEELEFTIRALAAGLKVVETPNMAVLHLGVRSGKDGSRLMRGYGVGFGAAFCKHVRLRTPGALRAIAEWLVLQAWRSTVKAMRRQPKPGFGLLVSVCWGICRSSMRRLDDTSPGLSVDHPDVVPARHNESR